MTKQKGQTRAERYKTKREDITGAIETAHQAIRDLEPEAFVHGSSTLLAVGQDGGLVFHENNRHRLEPEVAVAMLRWLEKWFKEEV